MKVRPILFNTEMVAAIIDGRKTQTRRLINPQPTFKDGTGFYWKGYMYGIGSDYAETVRNFTRTNCPIGCVGDQLWVRETYCYGRIDEHDSTEPASRYLYVDDSDYGDGQTYPIYKQMVLSDGIECDEVKWKPSIHMPRSASRITLEITKIRVERLNDISDKDAKAEGFDYSHNPSVIRMGRATDDAKTNFSNTWKAIYGTDSWEQNQWVWVIEFKRVGKDHV